MDTDLDQQLLLSQILKIKSVLELFFLPPYLLQT